jgi:hypothetical protein
VIAIGDGGAAVHPLTGERAAWLASLRHIPRWLWINPLPLGRWAPTPMSAEQVAGAFMPVASASRIQQLSLA